ncbi:hypothetical protein JTE90_016366 [Oedothorax gibbosus]|uniref:Uncharacterized protein n=1 Tax=Oedothorax gibbosus TaxID=931172 RepID=A0AAV6U8F5_9ARAC|nr:hypothetical protein JTE90_016366 [Oedothorax gibbosus]
MRQRMKKIVKFIRQLHYLRNSIRVDIKYRNFTWTIILLFFSILGNTLLIISLFFAKSNATDKFLERYTFGYARDFARTKYPNLAKFCIVVVSFLTSLWEYGTVMVSLIVCCTVQILSFRVFCSLNHSFKNILESNRISKNDLSKITSEFQKASMVIKTTNDCLSSIAFALIAFYAFNISYVISRAVGKRKSDPFTNVSAVGSVTQFVVHFVLLVLTSSSVDAEMLKSQNMVLRANSEDTSQILTSLLGVNEFLSNDGIMKYLSRYVCDTGLRFLCEGVMFLLFGTDLDQLNATRLGVYTAHSPAGSSSKSILHYGQLIVSGKFQKYDYRSENMLHYSQSTPPEYDVSKITTPVALIWGENDYLADPVDVSMLRNKLTTVVHDYKIPFPSFNHIDFCLALDAKELVYDKILQFLEKYR